MKEVFRGLDNLVSASYLAQSAELAIISRHHALAVHAASTPS
jgi:hypothetical protein